MIGYEFWSLGKLPATVTAFAKKHFLNTVKFVTIHGEDCMFSEYAASTEFLDTYNPNRFLFVRVAPELDHSATGVPSESGGEEEDRRAPV